MITVVISACSYRLGKEDAVTWVCVLVRQWSCRIRLSEAFLDVHSGKFDNVCRWTLYSCVHCLTFCLNERERLNQRSYGTHELYSARLTNKVCQVLMDKHAYVCFDVRIAVSDPREVSPTAHQSLNIAVLYAVLHSFFKKSIDPWNTRQNMDVSVRKLNKLF